MSTDFNYDETTIITTGPFKPKNRNVPMNARYRVETYADIATIPVPAVGELVFVLSDENNNSQQNIYVIKSLKASNLGVADSLVDEVVPLKTFLGTDDINLSDYITEDELNTNLSNKVDKVSGYSLVSDTEIARLANVDNYDDTELMNLIPDKTSDLENDSKFISSNDEIDATTLNGKKFSEPMTKQEYDDIADKDPDMIYLVDDESMIGLPNYSSSDANKVLAVNSNGTALAWIDGTEGNGLTAEQAQQLQTAYDHSQSPHAPSNAEANVQADWNETNTASSAYIKNKPANLGGDVILTSPIGLQYKLIVSDEGELSAEVIARYGEIIVNTTSLSMNEGSTATFTVTLDKAPSSNEIITMNVTGNNCTVEPSSLTFTTENYSIAQSVTVTGILDNSSYENKTDSIVLSNANVSSKTIAVTIVNTDVVTLKSISAVYNQGDKSIYPTTSLDSLKNNLVVTAAYSDNSTSTITDYSLSGTLTVGTSEITVTYQEKTTTFNVTVSEAPLIDGIVSSPIFYVDARYGQSTSVLAWDNMGTATMPTIIAQGPKTENYPDRGFINGALVDILGQFNFTWSGLPALNDFTIELNCKLGSRGEAAGMVFDSGTHPGSIYQQQDDTKYLVWGANKQYYLERTVNDKDCIQIRRHGATVEIFKNGKLATTINDAATGATEEGKQLKTVGFIGEVYSIIVYDRLLTDEELQQNRDYEASLNRGVD